MNEQKDKPAYELVPRDFYPIVGKRKFQERNAGVEDKNFLSYYCNQATLGFYNLAVIVGAAVGFGIGLEKLIEILGK